MQTDALLYPRAAADQAVNRSRTELSWTVSLVIKLEDADPANGAMVGSFCGGEDELGRACMQGEKHLPGFGGLSPSTIGHFLHVLAFRPARASLLSVWDEEGFGDLGAIDARPC